MGSSQVIDEMFAQEVETLSALLFGVTGSLSIATMDESALSVCGILLVQLTCCLMVRSSATSGSDSQGRTESAGTDIDINDILPLTAAVCIHIKLHF